MNNSTRERLFRLILLLPIAIFLVFAFIVPMGMMLSNSARHFDPLLGATEGWSAEYYQAVFSDPFYWSVIAKTGYLSLAAVLVCILIGYPVAVCLVLFQGRHRTIIYTGLLAPLFVSAIVRTYGWLILLGQGGPIQSALPWLGLSPMTRIIGTETAVVIGLVHLFLAMMVLPIAASLRNLDPAVLNAARIHGASPVRVYTRVIFPLSLPGVLSGAVAVFALSAGAFVTPAILGASKVRVMSYSIWEQFSVLHNFGQGSVLSIFLVVSVAAVVFLASSTLRSKNA
ncbi:ABC transporter permease [Bosea sp. (in: a-proteobacteria)]|uniref:ABC transporter permease n=1 Tax=Bosea sp. (in: a-proteobacteria) TaxID=1871050 RepID=UPI0026092800|nr:ABC transporter permease [Bosea sp. (in: a-proteobacteria)]MCO5089466.1 ABC transporter permease [Bosea sp. (in: a-proteobacteria)]